MKITAGTLSVPGGRKRCPVIGVASPSVPRSRSGKVFGVLLSKL